VLELWEVSGMIWSCVGVEDYELSEDVRVNGVFQSCVGLLVRVASVRRCGNEWNGMRRDGG
jgi:hypothetical protein